MKFLLVLCLLVSACGSNEQSEGQAPVTHVEPECENAELEKIWDGEVCNAKETK